MVTAQLAVVVLTLASVQGEPVKLPLAVPVLVNATVPAGTDGVPSDVSFTNDVQVTVWPVVTEDGEHITAVEVVLGPTVTVLLAVGPLPL
jgi:hypothetical protein